MLIESEMKDGDNEPVEIGGIYRDKVFEIWSVSANGYTIGKLENQYRDLPKLDALEKILLVRF